MKLCNLTNFFEDWQSLLPPCSASIRGNNNVKRYNPILAFVEAIQNQPILKVLFLYWQWRFYHISSIGGDGNR
jgi:hypothetical protein